MDKKHNISSWKPKENTALLLLEDGTLIYGKGFGAYGIKEGEICFNTALTGYEEILTDPSYQGQIITFTFPHIGNVGANDEDIEDLQPDKKFGALGAIFKSDISSPSNYRSYNHFNEWLKARGIIALSNIDTRALTNIIRKKGSLKAIIAHDVAQNFDIESLKKRLASWSGLLNIDLAKDVTSDSSSNWTQTPWVWNDGYQTQILKDEAESLINESKISQALHIVAIDYGIKRNILRLLAKLNVKITIVPAKSSAEEIFALDPDGIFLSNGPGDPSATAEYAVPVIQKFLEKNIPIFGICLGHQLLALAAGAQTKKMHQGHHGANHPVKDHVTGKVEIVSMNHGFTVDSNTLPENVKETHISLFDQTNCGLSFVDKAAFSVQYHPEASPGPQDSLYLFKRFYELMTKNKQTKATP